MFSTVRVVREHTQFFDDTEDLIVWSFISTGTFCRTWKISFDLVFTRPLTRSLFYVCLKLEFYFWLRLFVFVSFTFPDMRTLGHGLAEVLDALQIPYVIGLGEGAGANILARLGMDHPQRCLGLILIHCTSTVAGVMEYFRDRVSISKSIRLPKKGNYYHPFELIKING